MTTGLIVTVCIYGKTCYRYSSVLILTTIQLLETQEWTDERLQWNPAWYDNASEVVVRSDRIWTPELAVLNGFVTRQKQNKRYHNSAARASVTVVCD